MNMVKATTDGTSVVRYERLRRGNYFADFRRDKRLTPEIYHCIIQREGSTEILAWSQFRSLESALRAAERQLQQLSGTDAQRTQKPPSNHC